MIALKKISTFLILVSFVFSSSTPRELLKIHFLADHFMDHVKQDKKLSLTVFLIGHYLNEKGNDQDAEEDNKLPFKSIDPASLFSFISTVPNLQYTGCQNLYHYPQKEYLLVPADFISSQYHAAIWQPPRHS